MALSVRWFTAVGTVVKTTGAGATFTVPVRGKGRIFEVSVMLFGDDSDLAVAVKNAAVPMLEIDGRVVCHLPVNVPVPLAVPFEEPGEVKVNANALGTGMTNDLGFQISMGILR